MWINIIVCQGGRKGLYIGRDGTLVCHPLPADPGSNPSASTKMECLIFGYGCVGYENDCGEIERTEINIGHRHIKIIAVTAQ